MPRDIIDDPLPHRYRNAAEGGRRDGESGRQEAGGCPAGRGGGGRRRRDRRQGAGGRGGAGDRGGTGGGRLAGVIRRNRRA